MNTQPTTPTAQAELLAVLKEYGLPLTGDDKLDIWQFGELEVHREKRRRAAIAAQAGEAP